MYELLFLDILFLYYFPSNSSNPTFELNIWTWAELDNHILDNASLNVENARLNGTTKQLTARDVFSSLAHSTQIYFGLEKLNHLEKNLCGAGGVRGGN